MSPASVAGVILKLNVYLFVITISLNALVMFPYYLHTLQIANNIALDVANNNYINEENVGTYVDHLGATWGDDDANTFSINTFQEANVRQPITDGSGGIEVDGAGYQAFSQPLSYQPNSYIVEDRGNNEVAAVSVTFRDSSDPEVHNKTGIIDYNAGNFDPQRNNGHIVDGFESNNMSSTDMRLVNRGTPFVVEVSSRYSLVGATFGLSFNSAIPVESQAIGVTTQYYPYGGM